MDLGLVSMMSAAKQMSIMNEVSVKMMDKAIESVEQQGEDIQKLLDSASIITEQPQGVVSSTHLDVYI